MTKSKTPEWLEKEMVDATKEALNNLKKRKKLVLFGLGDLAVIAHEYFSNDSKYEVVGFTVSEEHLKENTFCDLPVVSFEEVETYFPPEKHDMHVCIVYGNLNRDRQKICSRAKDKRYDLASYISSRSFVSPSAKIGEHAFIFEDNTIQPFVEIGNNAILWSGNHIGHHSILGDNIFISSHVVISGHCNVGGNVFIGVNSTLANNTVVGADSWVMHGALLSGKIPPKSFVKTVQNEIVPLNESALFRALERAKK